MAKKKKQWRRFRHRVVRNLAAVVLRPYCRWKYHIRPERFEEQGDRAYLILLNHQTVFDQFFVGLSFRGPIYYLATEDIFSNGWVSSLIRWLVAPIPIKKQTTDIAAVMNCLRVAKEGGTIALAPEGNRTYSGKTEYMSPAIAGLAKKLKLPIALYRIEGGYGTQPRWSDEVRKGPMKAYVSQVIEPEEYQTMTNEELLALIETGLAVDDGTVDGLYRSNKRAEYLERAMYVCPFCGLSTFESKDHRVWCKTCGCTMTYGEDKTLTGEGREFPFRYVSQWYDYQKDFINQLDVTAYTKTPLYRDRAAMREVVVYKKKVMICPDAGLTLYGNRMEIQTGQETMIFPFEQLRAVTVLGRNKLNIYHNDRVYQFKGDKRFNALKYVHIYYRHKNMVRGEEDGQFLGL